MRRTVGVVDYGVGNHASVARAFEALGYRCRVTRRFETLATCDLFVLPGVGAFPAAMAALLQHGLADYLREQAAHGRALIGLCLGMQLLADESLEHGVTAGLGLITGRVAPLPGGRWHIGWNAIEVQGGDALLAPSDGVSVYFNHSYEFVAPPECCICVSHLDRPIVAGVRRGKVVGLQFHPEKSQAAGRAMLKNLVEGLLDA
ncbi:MAG: imidazole glycerol phosphate synthase subunit HisH [Betaproteobacteria bacterium]|nr:imidazole glycerol phosphate synthase subunit HisH [Betaproteobacteria bacterium]